jgi:hypothetical protein
MNFKSTKSKNLFVVLAIFIFSNIFSMCSINKWDEKRLKEISRITSPDSVVDAIIIEDSGGGATNDYRWLIYIEIAGQKIKDYDKYRFWATRVDSLWIQWSDARLLEVHYKKANIYHFNNYWGRFDVNQYSYIVEIKLVPNVNEIFALPDEVRLPSPIKSN